MADDSSDQPSSGGADGVRRKVWRAVGAIAVIAGVIPLGQLAADTIGTLWQNRQPQADMRRLAGLQTDVLLQHVTDTMGQPPTTIYSEVATAEPGQDDTVLLRDFMYVLDTVYVEVFVDDADLVRAYAITAKETEPVEVLIPMIDAISLGATPVGDTLRQTDFTYSACGVHTVFYYELSSMSNADTGGRRIAVGFNMAGTSTEATAERVCDALVGPGPYEVPLDSVETRLRDSYFGTDESRMTLKVFETNAAIEDARSTVPVNSVVVSSFNWDIETGMMAIHPDNLPR